jgi:hypothetical protein
MNNNNIIDKEYRTISIPRFDKNRKVLLKLINDLKVFNYDELIENFYDVNNDITIDSQDSIKDILDRMVVSKTLKLEFGTYVLQ